MKYKKRDDIDIVAIDFDGTVVEENFPEIGNLMEGAKETIKDLHDAGYVLLLWTCRMDGCYYEHGEKFCRRWLSEARTFLQEKHIFKYFRNINNNANIKNTTRKIYAHMYIDDLILGGFPGWDVVRDTLLIPIEEEDQ